MLYDTEWVNEMRYIVKVVKVVEVVMMIYIYISPIPYKHTKPTQM